MKTFGFYLVSVAVAFIIGGKAQKPKEKIVYKDSPSTVEEIKVLKANQQFLETLTLQNKKASILIEDLKATNAKLEEDLDLCLEREKENYDMVCPKPERSEYEKVLHPEETEEQDPYMEE